MAALIHMVQLVVDRIHVNENGRWLKTAEWVLELKIDGKKPSAHSNIPTNKRKINAVDNTTVKLGGKIWTLEVDLTSKAAKKKGSRVRATGLLLE